MFDAIDRLLPGKGDDCLKISLVLLEVLLHREIIADRRFDIPRYDHTARGTAQLLLVDYFGDEMLDHLSRFRVDSLLVRFNVGS